jgi:hypothetical protein
LHGQYGLVALAHEHNLRRIIEELGVRTSHIKTAKGLGTQWHEDGKNKDKKAHDFSCKSDI